jgi:hypothetical protein
MAWADRDDPVGKIETWNQRTWLPGRRFVRPGPEDSLIETWFYPLAVPLYRVMESWHDDDTHVDAYWGPSVHWNMHLEQYVMLLNRAKDADWTQEGVYIAFSPRLDDPTAWSAPQKVLNGGSWYPQVTGLEPGAGTDKVAGEWARFFMAGRSDHLMRVSK